MLPRIDYYLAHYYTDCEQPVPMEKYRFEIALSPKLKPINFVNAKDFLDWHQFRENLFYMWFFGCLNDSEIWIVLGFLDYQYQKFIEKNGDGSLFLIFIQETINDIQALSEARIKTILEWIETKRKELPQDPGKDQGAEAPTLKKIEWKGSPASFGYLFLELVKNGFIEPPLRNGEPNFTGLAKLCFQYFNVKNTDLEYLTKQLNPNSNLLSDTKRAKFTIPNISDLA